MTRIEDLLARDRVMGMAEPPSVDKTVSAVLARLNTDSAEGFKGMVGFLPWYPFGCIPWTVA